MSSRLLFNGLYFLQRIFSLAGFLHGNTQYPAIGFLNIRTDSMALNKRHQGMIWHYPFTIAAHDFVCQKESSGVYLLRAKGG